MKTETYSLPAYWASYLINGDSSGLEQYEEDTGEELELDVIALCCDFAEATDKELLEYYNIDVSDCDGDDGTADTIQEFLEDKGAYVSRVNGKFVYRQF